MDSSPDTEESKESTEAAATQDMEEPSEISSEAREDTRLLDAQMNGQSVPLNSKTGDLLPVQTSSTSDHPQCNWSCLVCWKTSPAHEEDPVSFGEKIEKIRRIILSTRSCIWRYLPGYYTVGIFSRSSESDYEWLINRLKWEPFHINMITVLPHYISNNGEEQFMEAVSRCTFGILYHTKNSGRINIVDVTDNLYNKELRYLSERLGKEKVIVVVDDLEDASSKEKAQILEAQPSIGRLAEDLFLFSANEK